MKYLQLTLILALAAIFSFALVGCDATDTAPTSTTETAQDDYSAMDLDQEYGGLTFTDEEEAFGDAYFTAVEAADLDAVSDDPLQTDAEVLEYEAMISGDCDSLQINKPVITAVKILWGQLDGDVADIREEFESMDWSGALSVDRGIVVVRRLILFEKPYDKLIMPRLNRHTVKWRSHTGPHYDGLIVQIIEPPMNPVQDEPGSKDEPEPVVNMMHFRTLQFQLDMAVADLHGYDEIHAVDEIGNAVHFEGMRLGEDDYCPQGFLSGIWVNDPDTDGGIFKGRWVDKWGFLKGYVRGSYGLNEAEERVFFGKYIGRGGRIEGLLNGTWTPGEEEGRGEFQGRWIGKDEILMGVLGGRYAHAPDRPRGFFSGLWATICADEAVEALE